MAENGKTVYVALASNAAIMVAKFVAGAVSGSSSLFAEGFHSFADTGDAVMVLIGQRRSGKPPDDLHPFGHAGVIIAAAAVFLSHRLEMRRLDGVGAIVIGLLMASVGAFLIYEISKLLVGERAVREDVACVRELVERDPAVRHADLPRTAHFGPNTLLVAVRAEFDPSLCAGEIAAAIERLHETIRREVPEAKYIFIEPRHTEPSSPAHQAAARPSDTAIHFLSLLQFL